MVSLAKSLSECGQHLWDKGDRPLERYTITLN